MHYMAVDINERRAVVTLRYHMGVPKFVVKCFASHKNPLLVLDLVLPFSQSISNNSNSFFLCFEFPTRIQRLHTPMDIQNLKAFVTVANLGSFSLAAAHLHLTQPAVSKRVAALEEELGHGLFHRINRKVELTHAGLLLLQRAQVILQTIEDTRQELADFDGAVSGELRVATSHHVGLHKLPPVLHFFVHRYPRVNLKFEFLDSEVAYERVARGDCELAVVTLGPTPHTLLTENILWADPLVFVASKALFNSENEPLTLQQLSRLPAILPDINTYTGRLVKACFDEHGLPLNIAMATNYLETIKMLVSVGLGWSLLPQTLVDEQLVILDLPLVISRNLGVITHPKRAMSNAAKAFLELLSSTA
jgi:DNA-binding transcriptional LysR family regulator